MDKGVLAAWMTKHGLLEGPVEPPRCFTNELV